MKKISLIIFLCAAGLTVFAQNVSADAPIPAHAIIITFDEKGEAHIQNVPQEDIPAQHTQNIEQNVQQNRDMNISVQMSASPSVQNTPVQTGAQPSRTSPQTAQTVSQEELSPAGAPDALVPADGGAYGQPAGQRSQTVTPGERGYAPYPAPDYNGKTYRIQIGAFKSIIHAQSAYDAVSLTGLSPAIEMYGDTYRIVVPYIPEDKVNDYAAILQTAGFSVWVRDE
jgi:cell division protein FtsN